MMKITAVLLAKINFEMMKSYFILIGFIIFNFGFSNKNKSQEISFLFMGDIMGDISGKRGKIMGMESDGSFQIIKAQVPQAELYHYATTVRSLTGGRGLHKPSHSGIEGD